MWQLVWKVLGSESAWEPRRPLVPEGAQLVPGKAPHQTASRVNAVGGWPQLGFPWPFRGVCQGASALCSGSGVET